jgi:hypothetical protein
MATPMVLMPSWDIWLRWGTSLERVPVPILLQHFTVSWSWGFGCFHYGVGIIEVDKSVIGSPRVLDVEMKGDKPGVGSQNRYDYLCQVDEWKEWGHLFYNGLSSEWWFAPCLDVPTEDGPDPRVHLCIEYPPCTGFGMFESCQRRGRFLHNEHWSMGVYYIPDVWGDS